VQSPKRALGSLRRIERARPIRSSFSDMARGMSVMVVMVECDEKSVGDEARLAHPLLPHKATPNDERLCLGPLLEKREKGRTPRYSVNVKRQISVLLHG